MSTTASASEPSEIARVLSVLTFYIFSCGCFVARPRNARAHKTTAHAWREEIENHPSLARTQSSTPSELPSTPVQPVDMLELPMRARIVGGEEAGWMMMPPPSVREVGELNRVINRARALERPGSARTVESVRSGLSGVSLSREAENLQLAGGRGGGGGGGGRRRRFEEGVLEDMDSPPRTGRRDTDDVARPRTARRRRFEEGILDNMEKPRPGARSSRTEDGEKRRHPVADTEKPRRRDTEDAAREKELR